MTKHTATFEKFEVVRVPFPFTDRTATKKRPAVILSKSSSFNRKIDHCVLAMITTKSHTPWPHDLLIDDLDSAGLPAPSIVRMKIFTLDCRLILGHLGKLSRHDATALDRSLSKLFGI